MASRSRERRLVWRWARPFAALAAIIISASAITNSALHTAEAQQRDKLGFALPGAPGEETTVLPLPDKPSIAVLPLDNLSDDPKQEYFSDGLADTLLTELSRLPDLFVIARNSSFSYKGKAVDVRQVGRELGVKFVLEGSVLRVGDQVRINAQLVDTLTGGHVWAEKFDGKFQDVFALQDQVTQKIVTALAAQLTPQDQVQVAQNETDSVEAYDAFLQGWAHVQRFTPDDAAAAIPHFERAIASDPEYSRAYAALAFTYRNAVGSGWTQRLGLSSGEAQDKARAFLVLAMEKPTALALRVDAGMLKAKRPDAALASAERAIALEPNSADSHLALAQVLVQKGEHEKALDAAINAKRLDPQNRIADFWRGIALFHLERLEEAATTFERQRLPVYGQLASIYGHLGRKDDARVAAEQWTLWRKSRGLASGSLLSADHAPGTSKDRERYRDGLRIAGVPDGPDGFATRPQDRLTGPDLERVLLGPWWYGTAPNLGNEHWLFTDGDEIRFGGTWASDEGRWYIEADQVCLVLNRLPGSSGGRGCRNVYRNPEGTRTRSDEYVFALPHGNFPFSVYAERPLALKDE